MQPVILESKIDLPDYILKAIKMLQDKGYNAYVVGGAVRDYLLGDTPHDFDLATSASPNKIIEFFKDYHIIDSGIKQGSLKVLIDKHPVDITTFRSEETYQDHRHPDSVSFLASPYIDSTRRDFTVNALYYDGKNILDFQNGIDDLKNKTIKAIGEPARRFEEDALRILRAVRFANKLNFEIDQSTLEMMREKKLLLADISTERKEAELKEMTLSQNFFVSLKKYSSILDVILPLDKLDFSKYNFDFLSFGNFEASIAALFSVNEINKAFNPWADKYLLFNKEKEDIKKLLSISKYSYEDLQNEYKFRLLMIKLYPIDEKTLLTYLSYRNSMLYSQKNSCDDLYKTFISNIKENNVPVCKEQLLVRGDDLEKLHYPKTSLRSTALKKLLIETNQDRVERTKEAQINWLKAFLDS